MTNSPDSDDTERSLTDLIKRGDRAAFDELVTRFQEPLYTFLSRSLGPELREKIPEVAKDTRDRLFSATAERPGYSDLPFRQLLFRFALDSCMRYVRRTRPVSDDELNPDQRALLGLLEATNMTPAQISDVFDIPIGTVNSRHQHLMMKLSDPAIAEKVGFKLHSAASASPDGREISVFIDPGDSQPSLIAELYVALSTLYQTTGGSGLTIAKEERRSLVPEVLE